MGIDQWTALAAVLATIIGCVVSMMLWLNRRHTELTAELHSIQLDVRNIEAAWADRMHSEISELKTEIAKGPPWLRELMDTQSGLLKQAINNAQIAIDVAEQHGKEMITVVNRIEAVEYQQETVLEIIKQRQNKQS